MRERDDHIIQHCVGSECPFLDNHNLCIHKLELEDTTLCMLVYENRSHSHAEIAKILGISKQAVIYLEKKALKKLRIGMLSQLRVEGLEANDILEEY